MNKTKLTNIFMDKELNRITGFNEGGDYIILNLLDSPPADPLKEVLFIHTLSELWDPQGLPSAEIRKGCVAEFTKNTNSGNTVFTGTNGERANFIACVDSVCNLKSQKSSCLLRELPSDYVYLGLNIGPNQVPNGAFNGLLARESTAWVLDTKTQRLTWACYAAHYDSDIVRRYYPNLRKAFLESKKEAVKFAGQLIVAGPGFLAKCSKTDRQVFIVKVESDGQRKFYDKDGVGIKKDHLVQLGGQEVPDAWFSDKDLEAGLFCGAARLQDGRTSDTANKLTETLPPCFLKNKMFRHVTGGFNVKHKDTGLGLKFVGFDENLKPRFFDELLAEHPKEALVVGDGTEAVGSSWCEDPNTVANWVQAGLFVEVKLPSI